MHNEVTTISSVKQNSGTSIVTYPKIFWIVSRGPAKETPIMKFYSFYDNDRDKRPDLGRYGGYVDELCHYFCEVCRTHPLQEEICEDCFEFYTNLEEENNE